MQELFSVDSEESQTPVLLARDYYYASSFLAPGPFSSRCRPVGRLPRASAGDTIGGSAPKTVERSISSSLLQGTSRVGGGGLNFMMTSPPGPAVLSVLLL